jgi:alpha-glucosidase (family GH31 glycosyl hydrolase)
MENDNEIKIPIKEDELWWGGCAFDGFFMPYSKSPVFSRQMNPNSTANQASPFLISNKGRYIWSDKGFDFSVTEKVLIIDKYKDEIIIDESCVTLRDAYKAAQYKYFPQTGKTPPDMFFEKPQYNTWIELTYNQNEDDIIKYACGIIESGMPVGILMIDCGWAEYYGRWKFHPGRFPNPRQMIDKLHKMGFSVMLWVCPFISADTVEYRFLRNNGYLVKDNSGKPSIKEWWDGYSAVLDFTNPGTIAWFNEQLNQLINDYNIDGFKFDAGDASFYNDNDITFAKTDANTQSELWAIYGMKYKFNEFRACWKCGGTQIVQRLCDKHHAWEGPYSLEALIPDCLAEGIIGHAFVCPDMIGGGEYLQFGANASNLDYELFVRYAQCAALMPMMQFSAAPWRLLDKKHFELCRDAALIHTQYADKILDLAEHAKKTGEPIIRYMEYVFPDMGYEKVTDQFMLGDNILVAPAIKKGARSKDIYVPIGKWKSENGEVVTGPCKITVRAPLDRLPRYEKIG